MGMVDLRTDSMTVNFRKDFKGVLDFTGSVSGGNFSVSTVNTFTINVNPTTKVSVSFGLGINASRAKGWSLNDVGHGVKLFASKTW
jgi:hypothetical protein